VTTEWELKSPLSTVVAHSRDISDHTPLILNTGEANTSVTQSIFKFELGWLLRDGFRDLVTKTWLEQNRGTNAMERWQNKIRKLRQYLRGWAKNTSGSNKKEKRKNC